MWVQVRVWDVHTLKCLATLTGHSGAVRALAASSKRVFSGSDDTTIKASALRIIISISPYRHCCHQMWSHSNQGARHQPYTQWRKLNAYFCILPDMSFAACEVLPSRSWGWCRFGTARAYSACGRWRVMRTMCACWLSATPMSFQAPGTRVSGEPLISHLRVPFLIQVVTNGICSIWTQSA